MTIFPEPPIFPNKTCRNDSMNLSSRHLSLSVVEASKALGQPHFVLQIFAAKLLDVLREKYSVDLPCTFSIDFLRTYIGLWSGGWCCLFSPSFQHKTDKQSQRQGLRVYQIPSAELFGNVFWLEYTFIFPDQIASFFTTSLISSILTFVLICLIPCNHIYISVQFQ